MCPRGYWQEPVAWPRVLFVSPWARSAACSSDRSVARSMGRLAVSLLSPAAPEASACSVAGIRWALEDLVASCLHHRQWHEVQARSKLVHARLPALARPDRLLPACSCLLHMKSVFVAGYALCLFPTSCVYSDSQDCSCLCRAGSGPLPACLGLAPACSTRSRCLSQVMPCVFSRLRVTFRGRARARVVPRVTFRGRARARVVPRVTFRGRAPAGTPAHQRTCSAGAGFPTPALPDKRT